MARLRTLRRQRDLDRVFQHGRWRRTDTVAVGVRHRSDDEPTRPAFVAGRQIGTAVRRNRARRRLREAYRLLADQVQPGADVVLVARERTGSADFRDLQAEIAQALRAEGLLPEKAEDAGVGQ
ncbi:MAG: ribonuclease P protein component [Armatimonadota bacterium]|nr:ribonuclease P protein component [Armatimonadota bacterium]